MTAKLFTQEIWDEILTRLIEGEGLNSICRDEHMPCRRTINAWIIKDEKLKAEYDTARELQADTHADQVLEIADDARNDYLVRYNSVTGQLEHTFHKEHVQRSELRVKSRMWLAAKHRPRKYGDKTQVELGTDPSRPVQIIQRIELVAPAGMIPAPAPPLPSEPELIEAVVQSPIPNPGSELDTAFDATSAVFSFKN